MKCIHTPIKSINNALGPQLTGHISAIGQGLWLFLGQALGLWSELGEEQELCLFLLQVLLLILEQTLGLSSQLRAFIKQKVHQRLISRQTANEPQGQRLSLSDRLIKFCLDSLPSEIAETLEGDFYECQLEMSKSGIPHWRIRLWKLKESTSAALIFWLRRTLKRIGMS